ncbi:MAG: hypothetical protein R3D68_20790 [Hyphomicrobiaceae bacterium]
MRFGSRAALIVALLSAMAIMPPSQAGILSGIAKIGARTARTTALHGVGALDNLAAVLKALPHRPGRMPLAAAATAEGHWRLTNAAGEVITAANGPEMARAIRTLSAGAGTAEARLSLHLSEDSVFRFRHMLDDLPATAELNVVIGKESFALTRTGTGLTAKLHAQVRPGIMVEIGRAEAGGRRLFDEAVWQLARTFNRADVRILSLEPGGPGRLPAVTTRDPLTKANAIDRVDPERLPQLLANLRGQTAIVTGRVEGGMLFHRSGTLAERSTPLDGLTRAAEAADVNLIVLQTNTGLQPGARNWLWQRARVPGLEQALQRPDFAAFLAGLVGPEQRMLVSVSGADTARASLRVTPFEEGARTGPLRPLTNTLDDVVSHVTASVVVHGASASLRSADRQRELDRRIVPGIPSDLQFFAIGNAILGLFAWGLSRRAWRRLWPPETREEYASALGYGAARIVREAAFALLFLPLTGVFMVLGTFAIWAWRLIAAFVWFIGRLGRLVFGLAGARP